MDRLEILREMSFYFRFTVVISIFFLNTLFPSDIFAFFKLAKQGSVVFLGCCWCPSGLE